MLVSLTSLIVNSSGVEATGLGDDEAAATTATTTTNTMPAATEDKQMMRVSQKVISCQGPSVNSPRPGQSFIFYLYLNDRQAAQAITHTYTHIQCVLCITIVRNIF